MAKTIGTALVIALALLTLLPASGVVHSTGPTQVGVAVRRLAFFGSSGVQRNTLYLPGGTYFFLPYLTDFYTFDTRIQNIEMSDDPKRGDRLAQDELRFKTVDGNDIGLDVIVSYRIDPQRVFGILEKVARSDAELKELVVRPISRTKIRDIFGELRTEEFYIAERRDEKSTQVAKALGAALDLYGVVLERVSTKDYRFNTEYQKAIEDKKVADQKMEKFKSETHAATEEYLRRLEQAQGEVNQMIAKADGDYERAKIDADAYFEQQSRRAQAVRAEGEADAKGITEMNKALAGAGGATMVQLRLAEVLAGKRILLVPAGSGGIDLRTTNLNQLLGLAGMQQLSNQNQSLSDGR